MGITANPYGVGAIGASREKVTGRCSFCGLLSWYERWPGGSTGPYCEHCLEHVQQPGELESTTLARLRDHEPRLQRYVEDAVSGYINGPQGQHRVLAVSSNDGRVAHRRSPLNRGIIRHPLRTDVELHAGLDGVS